MSSVFSFFYFSFSYFSFIERRKGWRETKCSLSLTVYFLFPLSFLISFFSFILSFLFYVLICFFFILLVCPLSHSFVFFPFFFLFIHSFCLFPFPFFFHTFFFFIFLSFHLILIFPFVFLSLFLYLFPYFTLCFHFTYFSFLSFMICFLQNYFAVNLTKLLHFIFSTFSPHCFFFSHPIIILLSFPIFNFFNYSLSWPCFFFFTWYSFYVIVYTLDLFLATGQQKFGFESVRGNWKIILWPTSNTLFSMKHRPKLVLDQRCTLQMTYHVNNNQGLIIGRILLFFFFFIFAFFCFNSCLSK